MYCPRNKFLARSRLSQNQDRRIRWRDLDDVCKNGTHARRSPDDLLERRGQVDRLAQGHVLCPKSLFGSLTFVDVYADDIPADNPTLLVEKRFVADKLPAILAVMSSETSFELARS